jgi:hypothetical protein
MPKPPLNGSRCTSTDATFRGLSKGIRGFRGPPQHVRGIQDVGMAMWAIRNPTGPRKRPTTIFLKQMIAKCARFAKFSPHPPV